MGRTEGWDAVVVGAGFAGLSAASSLSAAGARVLVLEAGPRLGGRATSFTDPATGDVVDNGQHLLLGCYHETFAFLARIGAAGHVRVQPHLEVPFVDPGGARSVLRCPALPSPFHLLAGLLEWEALRFRDRVAALRMMTPLRLARREARGAGVAAASPGETVAAWLERNGQTPRLSEMLWEPLAVAALNQAVFEAAAPPFARVLARMFGPDPRDAAVALPLRPLHLMYAEPARAFIEAHGGAVRTLAPARILVHDRDGRAVVETKGEQVVAPVVIAAVAWHALPDLFVQDPPALSPLLAAAARTAASPIVSVNLWFDRPVLDAPFVGLPGRRMQWVFDKRLAFGGDTGHLSLVSSGAAALVDGANAAIVALALDELTAALPEVRRARLLRASVVRERRATFSLAPGQPPRPGVQTPVPNLLLAGDWIDSGLPATIESAVWSGHRAAGAASSP